MNVRGNILIIWQGWKPNLQTSTFWHTISLSLSCCPPALPSILWFHHLISHPSCLRDLLNPPLPASTDPPPSLSLSLKCHLHFSVHILGPELPVDGLIFWPSLLTSFSTLCSLCSFFYKLIRGLIPDTMGWRGQRAHRPVHVSLNVHNKTLLWLMSFPHCAKPLSLGVIWEQELHFILILSTINKRSKRLLSLFSPNNWIKVFLTTNSCCNGLTLHKKSALQMVRVSIHTRRVVKFWLGRAVWLPGLVELITRSGFDLTLRRKTKN